MFARHAFPPLTVIGPDWLGAFGEVRLIAPLRPGRPSSPRPSRRGEAGR